MKKRRFKNITAYTIYAPSKLMIKDHKRRFNSVKNKVDIGVKINSKKYGFTRDEFIKLIIDNGKLYG